MSSNDIDLDTASSLCGVNVTTTETNVTGVNVLLETSGIRETGEAEEILRKSND